MTAENKTDTRLENRTGSMTCDLASFSFFLFHQQVSSSVGTRQSAQSQHLRRVSLGRFNQKAAQESRRNHNRHLLTRNTSYLTSIAATMRSLFVASSFFFAFVAILFHPTAGAPSCPACRRRAAGRGAPPPPPTHPDPIQGWVTFTAAQSLGVDWNSEASRAAVAGNGVTHAVPDWVHQVEPCVNWESATNYQMSADEMRAQGMNGNRTKTDVTDFLPRFLEPTAMVWLPSTLLEPRVTLYRGTTVRGFRLLQKQGFVERVGRYGWGLYFTTDLAVAWAFAQQVSAKESKPGDDDPAVVLKITVRPGQLECWAPHVAVLENEEDRSSLQYRGVWPFLEFVLRTEEQKNVVLHSLPLP